MLFLCTLVGLLQVLTTSTQPTSNSTTPTSPTTTPTTSPTTTPTTTTPTMPVPNAPTGNCTLFGADCSCASNITEVCSKGAITKCSKGVWYVTGNIILGDNADWDFQSDTIFITGDFTSTSSAQLTISVNPVSGSKPSFFVNVTGNTIMDGTLNVNLLDSPVGFLSVLFIGYTAQLGSGSYTIPPPTLPDDVKLCRDVLNEGQTVYTNGSYITIGFDTTIQQNTYSCATGRGDRSWVVALMILAGIHALLILIFCFVTCKKKSLYTKVWE